MENDRLDLDRFNKFGKDNEHVIMEVRRIRYRKNRTYGNYLQTRKKYEASDKGRLARLKTCMNRRRRVKEASKDLTFEEKEAIKQFYLNRPEGMHVDHIIPIAMGGKHCLSNLQYLPPKVNFEKAWRLDYHM